MISVFKVSAEIQGDIRRFNSVVNSDEITFNIISADKKVVNVLSSYWNGSYEFGDINIEQGRRFIIDIKISAFVFPTTTNMEQVKNNLKCVCKISNKKFDVVECKIENSLNCL